MQKFDLVSQMYENLPYMKQAQAMVLRDMIIQEDANEILEIGFHKGKSSAFIAAILEDRGKGSLTTVDMRRAKKFDPNIDTVLESMGLSHRVTPIYCKRSYTWELQKLVNAQLRPQFDFCYFDGGHTWDETGFGTLLVDMLLRPGGVLVLDAMEWSMAKSKYYQKHPSYSKFSQDEQKSKPVRLVWDTILPHLGYEYIREYKDKQWGVARKPLEAKSVSAEGLAGNQPKSLLFGN